jgi:Na+-driven multidrug efflux pump
LIWGSCLYCCCYVTLKTGGLASTTILIDSGLMWGICVPLAWILVKFTNISLWYIYICVTAFDIIKYIISYSFVKRDKWLVNLSLTVNEGSVESV